MRNKLRVIKIIIIIISQSENQANNNSNNIPILFLLLLLLLLEVSLLRNTNNLQLKRKDWVDNSSRMIRQVVRRHRSCGIKKIIRSLKIPKVQGLQKLLEMISLRETHQRRWLNLLLIYNRRYQKNKKKRKRNNNNNS